MSFAAFWGRAIGDHGLDALPERYLFAANKQQTTCRQIVVYASNFLQCIDTLYISYVHLRTSHGENFSSVFIWSLLNQPKVLFTFLRWVRRWRYSIRRTKASCVDLEHKHTHTHTHTHPHTHTHGRDVTQDTCYLGQLDVCESIKLCRAVLVSSGHVLTNELDPCGTTCLELPLNLLRGLYGPRSSLRPAHATDGCFCTTFLPKRIAVEALRCGLHWYRQAKIT